VLAQLAGLTAQAEACQRLLQAALAAHKEGGRRAAALKKAHATALRSAALAETRALEMELVVLAGQLQG
jgi:hypothetical protein